MTRIDRHPPGVPCFVDTLTDDVPTARRFYEGVFGWRFAGPAPLGADATGEYWVARLGDRDVAGLGSRPAPELSVEWTTYVSVPRLPEALESVRGAGGAIVQDVVDAAPAGRLAIVTDPTGAALGLWEPGERHGAATVNEPSAWAMSALMTTDAAAAREFYGAVFGWRLEPFADAGPGVELCRLPGYVGGTDSQPVPRDVVAVMIGTGPGGPPSAWTVDFWVADADAASGAADQLGGAVREATADAGMFRRATLADPDGATFTVSELRLGTG